MATVSHDYERLLQSIDPPKPTVELTWLVIDVRDLDAIAQELVTLQFDVESDPIEGTVTASQAGLCIVKSQRWAREQFTDRALWAGASYGDATL